MKNGLLALIALVTISLFATNASAQTMAERTRAGSLGLGLGSTFNYGWIQNEVVDEMGQKLAEKADNSTLFLLVRPEFGYFFSDRAQATFSVGYLMRRLQREQAASNSGDWLFGGGVKYHIDIAPRVALVPGIGASFYVGGSTRSIPRVDPATGEVTTLDEQTSTWGVDGNGTLEFSYLMGERTALRAGLDLHILYGNENLQTNVSTSILNFNAGLNLAVFYFF